METFKLHPTGRSGEDAKETTRITRKEPATGRIKQRDRVARQAECPGGRSAKTHSVCGMLLNVCGQAKAIGSVSFSGFSKLHLDNCT